MALRNVAPVDDAARAFARRGVTEIRDFFTAREFSKLRRHADSKTRGGRFRSMEGDNLVAGAPCEYGDPVAERLLWTKTQYLSNLLQLDLVPTYSYMRLYRLGDRLDAHRDRPACEITVSASLAAAPQWPLRILVEGHVLEFRPAPRGAVVFRGPELLHWRDALSEGGPITQVLFHYVQRHGPYRLWAYDRRPRGTEPGEKSASCS